MVSELEQRLVDFDAQVEREKAETGEVTLRTALAWWNVATTLRDEREFLRRNRLTH